MAGLASTLGNGTMTNDLVEFATDTDVFLLIGTNTSECHPIIAMQMQRGLERGAKMIVVDPKRTDMAKKADVYLQIPVGANIKTLNTIMNVIISENLQDTEFIEKYAEGFEYLKEAVKDFTPERFERETGVKKSSSSRLLDFTARLALRLFATLWVSLSLLTAPQTYFHYQI